MRTLLGFVQLALLLFGSLGAAAQGADRIEVVALKSRSAEELMPILAPMLNADEAISGSGYQLVVRAAPARLEAIRELVGQLDQAVRQLRISVRRAAREEIERERVQANIAVGAAAGGDVEARGRAIVRSTRDKDSERNHYQVTALEGTPAFIQTGEAFPTPVQSGYLVNGRPVVVQGIEYQQLGSGFHALARTHGDEVTVDVSPRREAFDPQRPGHIRTTSLVTTVRGRVGEWLELGGTSRQASSQGGGLLRSTRGHDASEQTLWLKVERAE